MSQQRSLCLQNIIRRDTHLQATSLSLRFGWCELRYEPEPRFSSSGWGSDWPEVSFVLFSRACSLLGSRKSATTSPEKCSLLSWAKICLFLVTQCVLICVPNRDLYDFSAQLGLVCNQDPSWKVQMSQFTPFPVAELSKIKLKSFKYYTIWQNSVQTLAHKSQKHLKFKTKYNFTFWPCYDLKHWVTLALTSRGPWPEEYRHLQVESCKTWHFCLIWPWHSDPSIQNLT